MVRISAIWSREGNGSKCIRPYLTIWYVTCEWCFTISLIEIMLVLCLLWILHSSCAHISMIFSKSLCFCNLYTCSSPFYWLQFHWICATSNDLLHLQLINNCQHFGCIDNYRLSCFCTHCQAWTNAKAIGCKTFMWIMYMWLWVESFNFFCPGFKMILAPPLIVNSTSTTRIS